MQVVAIRDIIPPSQRMSFNDVYIAYELMDTDLHQIIRSHQVLSEEHCQVSIKYLLCLEIGLEASNPKLYTSYLKFSHLIGLNMAPFGSSIWLIESTLCIFLSLNTLSQSKLISVVNMDFSYSLAFC